jgi:hypothetical protein
MTSTTRQLKEVREQVERLCEDLARTGRDQSERESLIADQAAKRALAGVHELFFHEDRYPDLPGGVEVPDEWTSEPFARFAVYRDAGDSSVGVPGRSYWAMTEDQTGTVLFNMAKEMLTMNALLRKSANTLRMAAEGTASAKEMQTLANEVEAFTRSASLQPPANYAVKGASLAE